MFSTENAKTSLASFFVPKARDGSLFLPDCKQGKGYKIGRKGEEVYVSNYHEALRLLEKMPRAYWRRPNNLRGIFGIVTAEEWVKIELDQ